MLPNYDKGLGQRGSIIIEGRMRRTLKPKSGLAAACLRTSGEQGS